MLSSLHCGRTSRSADGRPRRQGRRCSTIVPGPTRETAHHSAGRLRRAAHHPPTPVFPGVYPALEGFYGTEIDPGTDQARADLWLRSTHREGIDLQLNARREMASAGPGTRYLTEAHFEDPEASLVLQGVEYEGRFETFDLDIDLYHGIAYGTIVVRFMPTGEAGEPVDVGMDLAGYLDASCFREDEGGERVAMTMYVTPDDDRRPYRDDAPEACIALFEALRATPDDPNAPPPPYSLDDTPDDGPGSTPFAPPPG